MKLSKLEMKIAMFDLIQYGLTTTILNKQKIILDVNAN